MRRSRLCSQCGHPNSSNYCTRCGAPQLVPQKAPSLRASLWKPALVIAAVAIVLTAVYMGFGRSVEPSDVYEDGLRTPAQVLQDIEHINSYVRLKCADQHLNDWDWTCPKVSEEQATRIVSRLMYNLVLYYTTIEREHIPEETIIELSTEINRIVFAMRRTPCSSETQNGTPNELLKGWEIVGFVEQCEKGWRLSRAWEEVIARRVPEPTPDWEFYYRNLPPEMRP